MPDEAEGVPDRTGPPPRWLTWSLAATACVAAEAAVRRMYDWDEGLMFFTWAAGILVIAVLTRAIGGPLIAKRAASASGVLNWVVGFVVVAITLEVVFRIGLGDWPVFEVLQFIVFRDIVIALAMVSHHRHAEQACLAISMFLMIFATSMADTPWIRAAVVVFTVVGVWWLLGRHWDSLQQSIEASSKRSLPRRWVLALPLLLVPLLLALPVAGRHVQALDGFMPTSGGRYDSSPSARSGVGDGDALVPGRDDIRSFAALDDAPFATSHEPTLYDVFDESYNEPVKNARTEPAISLPPQTAVRREDPSMATSRTSGREFSTLRRSGRPLGRRIADLESAALLYVKGRVPVHLKLESFDLYDGIAWLPEACGEDSPPLLIDVRHEKPWLRIPALDLSSSYARPEVHSLKVVDLDTNRIPSPNQVTAVHIDKVDRSDFYGWAQPGIVRLDRAKIPDQTVIHVQSRVLQDPPLAPRRCDHEAAALRTDVRVEGSRQFSDDHQSLRVRTLAESWVKDVPPGLPQIETIVSRLKADYVLDREGRGDAAVDHSVADFLFTTRRGPDYLFASTAVWMLRSLGYSSRLVSGVYADPKRHDRRLGHTVVTAADVHFWVEVETAVGNWMTVEPTPGYAVLGPPMSIGERLLALARVACTAVARRPLVVSALALILASLVWHRGWLADRLELWALRFRLHTGNRDAVLQHVRHLDRRCRRTGLPRPVHVTPSRWLAMLSKRIASAVPDAGDHAVDADEFLKLAERALYAPKFRSPATSAQVQSADRLWSWKRLAALAACGKSHPWPFSTQSTAGNTVGFLGRQPPRPVADDFIHRPLASHDRKRCPSLVAKELP